MNFLRKIRTWLVAFTHRLFPTKSSLTITPLEVINATEAAETKEVVLMSTGKMWKLTNTITIGL